jgi:exonuclease SbcC
VRPLELALEGFRSYRTPTTFDFQDRGLFGIVGPTGAGKSSVLDALIYSLYGKTPQIGKDTKKLITSGAGVARVRLVFDVDGTSWEVLRVLRREGPSQVILKRLGEGTPDTSGERAVNDRIADIVGLDFDAFCSSVTLPQGEFDRFLKATPTDRSRILKRIFRYERVDAMRDLAKQRVAGIDVELKAVQAELLALPPEPEALLAHLEAQRIDRDARVNALREGVAAFSAAQAVVAAAEEHLLEIARRSELVERTVTQIPAVSVLEALAAEEDSGLARSAAAEAGLEEARHRAEAAEAAAAQRESEVGGEALATARDLSSRRVRTVVEAAGRREDVARRKAAAARAAQALEAQERAAATAEAAAAAAQRVLRAAQEGHAAHLLRAELRPGQPCPVCAQEVTVVPDGGPVPEALDAAEQAATTAVRVAREQAAEAAALLGAASSAFAKLQAAEEEMAAATKELLELDEALARLLGSGVEAAAEVARREALIASAARDAAAARKRADVAAQAAHAAQRLLETSARKRRQLAGELIRISTILGVEGPGTEDEAGSLAGAAKRARDAGVAMLEEQARLRREVLADEAESRDVLAGLRERLGLGPRERIEDALQAASEAVGALGQRIEQARRAIEQQAILEARTVEIQGRRSVYQRLAADLTDAKFIAYLLDADRQRLASVGSEKLFQLTGRYRFDDEGQFHLLDLANDVVRSPDTLSGGETFLASLALALALAEAVAEGGSRLDCFFLDEGFGSLDAASLDLAIDGVESLALPGRLIGVISHVGGVQARLDDLIVLEKANDGSTVVVQTEGPIAYPTGSI